MNKALERALRQFDKGKDLSQIAAEMTPAAESELLRRCAATRTFDRDLFEDVLRLVPTEVGGDELFDRLVDNPVVQTVPRPKGLFRVAQDERARLLSQWIGESDTSGLLRLRQALRQRYATGSHKNPVEELYQIARLEPAAAQELYESLFRDARSRSDLALCDELIGLFSDAPNLPPQLRKSLGLDLAYLNARGLWADEFYRTGSYLERKQLVGDLRLLMMTDVPGRWVYQIHAAGGTGKTMFIRWAIARWCVEQRIPCARIDFDFANPAELARHPETLALQIARQWNRQLPGAPLDLLIGRLGPTRQGGVSQPMAELAKSLTLPDGLNALVVLDTLEEVLIPQRPQLIEVLRHLNDLHQNSLGGRVRVMLSGRYDLSKRLQPEELELLGPTPIHRKVFRFKTSEARKYLTDLRGLADDDRVLAAIERARGNPLKLWLFSEILKSEPSSLTAADIRNNLSVEVEFLIRRVVLRIGENQKDPVTGEIPDLYKGMRWVLRYGVVPRRLTLDFLLADPIRERLLNEIAGKAPVDKAGAGLEKLRVPSEPFPRAETPPEFKAIWEELEKYAGGSSWVRVASEAGETKTLVFTPDVLNPMRALLLEQEHDLFVAIHSEALDYFQKKADGAARGSDDRLRWLREVVYHDFQRRGEEAVPAWRNLIASDEFRDSPSWRKVLAEEITGRAYVEDDDPPHSILRKDGKRMIAPGDLVLAYYHKARASADLARQDTGDSRQEWRDALSAFRRYEQVVEQATEPAAEPARRLSKNSFSKFISPCHQMVLRISSLIKVVSLLARTYGKKRDCSIILGRFCGPLNVN